jgi:Domain of unknown function (DUF4156)
LKIRRVFVSASMVALLAGCTWVKLTAEGAKVKQATESDVAACTRIGTATASTKDRVLFQRGSRKVEEELIVLGANQAASIGGNAMVPTAPPSGGNQTFIVYKCE